MPSVRPFSSKFIPYFCLFLSGLTSLTYELIWIKQLRLVFGGTLYAISAVLCAFMAGLALGAWGISKYLQRPGR
jgi:spermidine synthase